MHNKTKTAKNKRLDGDSGSRAHYSEVRGGRMRRTKASCKAQWVITGQFLSIITPSEVHLCGYAAKKELFTA